MTTHQQKKLDFDDLKAFRDRFRLPLTDEDVEQVKFYKPADNSPEMQYLHARRAALGGYLPRRRRVASKGLIVPPMSSWGQFALDSNGREMSTTMALVRMLTALLKDKEVGSRVVPIVADEARTFGMANMFRQVSIYSPLGQLYEPEDLGSMVYYREDTKGQVLKRDFRKRARYRRGLRRRPRTACITWPCCRSTSTTRCSASSGSAI
jgi:pyruvate dehydrogenase E1 component